MKLISLNTEFDQRHDRTVQLIEKERPDIVAIQEATHVIVDYLKSNDFTVLFVPMTLRSTSVMQKEVGILLASHHPITFTTHYYHGTPDELFVFDKRDIPNTAAHLVILGQITDQNKSYGIGTTHFTWAPDGRIASMEQKRDMKSFVAHVQKLQPHVMCGDFNIPRRINELYGTLTQHYEDAIPLHYTSSLDKKLHRVGSDPKLAHLFESFMVDYILTQPPYTAKDIRLEFGISDHAAVIATIEKT